MNGLPMLLSLAPVLVAVALARPIILDRERGTYRLGCTQSITRGRWVAARFGLAIVTAVVACCLLAGLLTWYREPLDAVYGPFDSFTSSFDIEGIVPVAYVLFALGAALAVGVVSRSSVLAVVVTFVAYSRRGSTSAG